MDKLKHIAIDGTNLMISSPLLWKILKGECIDYIPELVGKRGVLFSNITLAKFMEEEAIHDDYSLTAESKRSIRTFSTGEQKKALLEHLLKKQPDFILLDNPFDALDVESVANLKKRLIELAEQITIIQVFKRRSDLLPFITYAIRFENEKVVFSNGIENFLKKYTADELIELNGKIPPPYSKSGFYVEELVYFSDVTVNYNDRPILNNINWTIKPGEFWQLIGPNGSGKTTLLSMINGDNPKAYGQNIRIFGRKKGTGESVWQIKELIGYFTPSMTELYKHRHTAQQMVVSGLLDSIGLYRKPGHLQIDLANQWLRLLGIYDNKDKAFVMLSQVQQRMVMIARAMIKHPPLLILDEPSTGLDDKSAAMLSALINKMAEEGNSTILYVSHRKEPGLNPEFIYQLIPEENGSVGKVV